MILGIIARSFRRLAAGAIALTAVSGCSLLFVEGPPHDHASRHFFDCTTSLLAPGIDATLTGALALSVLGVESDQSHTTGDIVMQSALVVGAMASATYGYLQVSKCRQAKDDLGERLINMPYLGVPPWDASRAPPPPPARPRRPRGRAPTMRRAARSLAFGRAPAAALGATDVDAATAALSARGAAYRARDAPPRERHRRRRRLRRRSAAASPPRRTAGAGANRVAE